MSTTVATRTLDASTIVDTERLQAQIEALANGSPTVGFLSEFIARDASGIDPSADSETDPSLHWLLDGNRVAAYIQASYINELAKIRPGDAAEILLKMSHLRGSASMFLTQKVEIPHQPDSDAELLDQADKDSRDVGA